MHVHGQQVGQDPAQKVLWLHPEVIQKYKLRKDHYVLNMLVTNTVTEMHDSGVHLLAM